MTVLIHPSFADLGPPTRDAEGPRLGPAPVASSNLRRLVALAIAVALVLIVAVGPASAATPPRLSIPIVSLDLGGKVTTTSIPVIVSWGPAATSGPIVRYRLRVTRFGGPWRELRLAMPRSRQVRLALGPGASYTFNATAVGPSRSTSRSSLPVIAGLYSETAAEITYAGHWTGAANREYIGSHTRTTGEAGASATWSGTALAVALLGTRGPTRGIADLTLDRGPSGSVNLSAPINSFGRVLAVRSFASEQAHAFGMVARGGVNGRIDIDGVAVLRPATSAPLQAVGDIASCDSPGDELSAALAAGLPGPLALLGDLAYPAGSADNYRNCFEPSWGSLVSRSHPVPGNHEYATPDASAYYAYFGTLAGDPAKGWYAYRVGSWQVYALNSNCSEVGGCGPRSAQYRWLRSALTAHPRACVLAYWHHPRLSSGSHGNDAMMASLWRLLAAHGSEVILAGHDHDYERLAPADARGRRFVGGIREFVVGTGGAPLRPFTRRPLPITQFRQDSAWGLLSLRLGVGTYSWQFLEAGSGASLDSGSSTCH